MTLPLALLLLVLAIAASLSSRAIRRFALRKIRQTGAPELPESTRARIGFWVRATLVTALTLLAVMMALKR